MTSLRRYLERMCDRLEAVLGASSVPGRVTHGTVGAGAAVLVLVPAPYRRFEEYYALRETIAAALWVTSVLMWREDGCVVIRCDLNITGAVIASD